MKRKKKRFTLMAISLLLLIAVMTGIWFNNEKKFIVMNFLSRVSAYEIGKMSECVVSEKKTMNFKEFSALENVTINDSLILVNGTYQIGEWFETETIYHEERNVYMNECVQKSFDEISKAVYEKFNETLYISSAFRTYDDQVRIKQEKGDIAQEPGSSEHQTGLALDVFVQYHSEEAFVKCEAGQFVNERCGDYGFIIRYPSFGESRTGISYEPWHIRYVGYPHSKIINESYITLEGYIDNLNVGQFYQYDNYIITRQNPDELEILDEFKTAVASYDNTGTVIITFEI